MTPGALPLEWNQYTKHMIFQEADASLLKQRLLSYQEIAGGKTEHIFRMMKKQLGPTHWIMLACPAHTSFYLYHNLYNWLAGSEEQNQASRINLAVAIHRTAPELSYICAMDGEPAGDALDGMFRDGTPLRIYLPEAIRPKGNLQVLKAEDGSPGMWAVLNNCGFLQADFSETAFRHAEVIDAVFPLE